MSIAPLLLPSDFGSLASDKLLLNFVVVEPKPTCTLQQRIAASRFQVDRHCFGSKGSSRSLASRLLFQAYVPQEFKRSTALTRVVQLICDQVTQLPSESRHMNVYLWIMPARESISNRDGTGLFCRCMARTVDPRRVDAEIAILRAKTEAFDAEARRLRTLERLRPEGGSEGLEENLCCSICLAKLHDHGSKASRMPCSHAFHHQCIAKWLTKSDSCPLCRFQLPS